eukprot:TRINITY_DN57629_c0_g1_i1.p1 TRINITY_DN57629_c0_g1~~TRINITY_DN57629_c0_g1_i1.p1  ORF type:complete len:137 (-),score=6.45 TRINITY_DN57629_c0_g1_i1:2-412(-)
MLEYGVTTVVVMMDDERRGINTISSYFSYFDFFFFFFMSFTLLATASSMSLYICSLIRSYTVNWVSFGFDLTTSSNSPIPAGTRELRSISTASRESLLSSPSRSASIASRSTPCLLYTSDAADEEDSVDLGGCRII